MIEGQKDSGVAWDIIAQAIADYDGWMLDDDYDAMLVLHRIIGRMKERAAFYRGADAAKRVKPTRGDEQQAKEGSK